MKSNIFLNEFYLIYSAIHINSYLEFELFLTLYTNLKNLKFLFLCVKVILCSSKFKICVHYIPLCFTESERICAPSRNAGEDPREQQGETGRGWRQRYANSCREFSVLCENRVSNIRKGHWWCRTRFRYFHFLGPLRFWFPVSSPSLD